MGHHGTMFMARFMGVGFVLAYLAEILLDKKWVRSIEYGDQLVMTGIMLPALLYASLMTLYTYKKEKRERKQQMNSKEVELVLAIGELEKSVGAIGIQYGVNSVTKPLMEATEKLKQKIYTILLDDEEKE